MRFVLVLAALALTACLPPGTPATSGAADFVDLCAPCHGVTGVGNGPMAAGLAKKPANLTTLAARNGGLFPTERVMNKIWGYSRGKAVPSMMPKFAPLLASTTVLVDVGDGVQTPTPVRLIDLANYLVTIQKK